MSLPNLLSSPYKLDKSFVRQLQEHPEMLETLSPDQFEMLIYGLLSGFGWEIQNEPMASMVL